MKRLLLVFFILPLLTTCEMFDNDMPAFLDFYSGTAKIESHSVDGSYIEDPNDKDKVHISPESDRTITFHLNNQQKYDLKLGINWTNQNLQLAPPETPSDYTLEQDTNDKSLIRLMFTKEFLMETDKAVDGGDISATISLTEPKSGREFESYSYKLESNSPPPPPEEPMLMKEDTAGTQYVLCFKLPNVTSDLTHRDIKTLLIADNSNGTDPDEYAIDFTGTNTGDGAVTDNDDSKIISNNQPSLFPWADGEVPFPTDYDGTKDGIFYKTGLTIEDSSGEINPINYTVTLIDTEGLKSKVVISNELPPSEVTITATIKVEEGTYRTDDNKYYTKNNTVVLILPAVTAADGITAYQITNIGTTAPPSDAGRWEIWDGSSTIESLPHTLHDPSNIGLKTIFVWVKNSGGDVFSVAKIEVTLDKTALSIDSVKIGGVSAVRNKIDLSSTSAVRDLVIVSSKAVKYQITETDNVPSRWADGNPAITNTKTGLSFVHGETRYIWVKDIAENTSTYPVTISNSVVYLDTEDTGSAEDGSEGQPAKTIDQAIALLGGRSSLTDNATILVMKTIEIAGTSTWSPATALTLKRNYPTFKGIMVHVNGGVLNLENIILDGENKMAPNRNPDQIIGSLAKVSNIGVLSLNNGTILRNNNATNSGGGVLMNKNDTSSLAKRNTLTMSGNAKITGNTAGAGAYNGGPYYSGGGVHMYYGFLTMSGDAEINGNGSGDNGGGVCLHSSSLTMIGNAKITLNVLDLDFGVGNGSGVYLENSNMRPALGDSSSVVIDNKPAPDIEVGDVECSDDSSPH